MLMVQLLGEMLIFVIGAKALKATTGVHFSQDQCREPTHTYVDGYKVLSDNTQNALQCAVMSVVDDCKNFLFRQKTCACATNDNTNSTKDTTVLNDLIKDLNSASDPTKLYMSKPLTAKLCKDERYTWIPEMTSCIRVVTSFTRYSTACQTDATHLVDLSTQSKSRALNRYLFCNGFHSDFWIGINDITSEGTYTWSDGSPATYTNWASSQPKSFFPDNDCGFIAYDATDKQFYWKIGSRNKGFQKYICESP